MTRSLHRPLPSVAVIGAGISGLTCAKTLQDHGIRVSVFEKSRGAGGRMSTRRTPDDLRFDHGAQYFTARDSRFRLYVDSWQQDKLVEPWLGRIVVLQEGEVEEEKTGTDRYVAVPGMNAICKHLAKDIDVHFEAKVASPELENDKWQLKSDAGVALGIFDSVIVSAPAAQASELLIGAPRLAARAKQACMTGCWAVMVAFEESLNLPFAGAFVHGSPISWIALNSDKPGRASAPETWVIHASPEWSDANIEREATDVEAELLDEFWRCVNKSTKQSIYSTAHRWRFALPTEPLEARCLFDDNLRIGACGDWCGGPRVEGAFLSGTAAAGRIVDVCLSNSSAM